MKSAFIAVAMAGALSLAITGTASASALGHPEHHSKPKPAAAPQVSGATLGSALLPAAAFGDGYTSLGTLTSGNRVTPATVTVHVAKLSCGYFELSYGLVRTGFGNTAGVTGLFRSLGPQASPSPVNGFQSVLQFQSTTAAASFYGQVLAKYQSCRSFTESDPGAASPPAGVSASTVAKTTVGHYQAFRVSQVNAAPDPSTGQTSYNDILVAVAGTNVYQLWKTSDTNDEPSPALMARLISRVQKLYSHR